MNAINTILVGTDFSECSWAALRQAMRIAAWNGATLHVLHVIDAQAVSELAEVFRVPLEEQQASALTLARRELKRWLEAASRLASVHADVVIGMPLAELLKWKRQLGAELIVLGAQGVNTRSPEAGTLALRVLRKSPMKVLLVDGTCTTPFQRVVACVDFSETAREVVAQARRVGAQDRSRVDFLHVFYGPWRRLHYAMPTLEASPDFQQQYQGLLQRQLDDFVGDLAGLDASSVLREASSSGSGIAEYARQRDADLVILGARGRANLREALLGSTAERLLKALPCSVLVVKPPCS